MQRDTALCLWCHAQSQGLPRCYLNVPRSSYQAPLCLVLSPWASARLAQYTRFLSSPGLREGRVDAVLSLELVNTAAAPSKSSCVALIRTHTEKYV